jgi:hypothetical protein
MQKMSLDEFMGDRTAYRAAEHEFQVRKIHRRLSGEEERLTFRPISETIRDTLAWDRKRADADLKVGLHPAREKELLDKWKAKLN